MLYHSYDNNKFVPNVKMFYKKYLVIFSTDVCTGFVCQNDGACVFPDGNAMCQCTPGYMGSRCELGKRERQKWSCLAIGNQT